MDWYRSGKPVCIEHLSPLLSDSPFPSSKSFFLFPPFSIVHPEIETHLFCRVFDTSGDQKNPITAIAVIGFFRLFLWRKPKSRPDYCGNKTNKQIRNVFVSSFVLRSVYLFERTKKRGMRGQKKEDSDTERKVWRRTRTTWQEIRFITFQQHCDTVCHTPWPKGLLPTLPTHFGWSLLLWLRYQVLILYVKHLPSLLVKISDTTCLPSFVSRLPFPSSCWRKSDCVTV